MRAQCQCGQLQAEIAETTDQVVACHCIECQRRSGSPFGVIAYYPDSQVTCAGKSREYRRVADSGNGFTSSFCPECGTTVWCSSEAKPGWLGIPVGTISNPDYPRPVRSVWEQSMHRWVAMPQDIPHFPRGRT